MLGSGRKEGSMPRIKHTVEQIITKLREAEVAIWNCGMGMSHLSMFGTMCFMATR